MIVDAFGSWVAIGKLYLNHYDKWVSFPTQSVGGGIYRLTPSASRLEKVKSSAWLRPFYLNKTSRINMFAQRIYPQTGNKLVEFNVPPELGLDIKIGFEIKRICRNRDRKEDKPWFVKLEYLDLGAIPGGEEITLALSQNWNYSGNSPYLQKNGNFIELVGQISSVNSPGYQETILVLPTEYRPSQEIVYWGKTESNPPKLSIDTLGNLKYWFGTTSFPIDCIFRT
ncbi:MAG: hypothetical protein RH949_13305 [Coleofasciculus sp. A1-SPW-01]|uniref:hypothetical protein n=1 Tax=Coleofasciculus sp. A1-SPW-01 TaxID=3070819 RepID=UPI003303152B